MHARLFASLVLLRCTAPALANTCKVEVESDDAMKFNTSEIKINADCTEVNLTLKHTGKLPVNAMGHNWVLTKSSDFRSVAIAGGKATPDDSYLPKGDARVIASTKLVGGGESVSITFPTAAIETGGDYTFFCSFPGHWSIMKGKFVRG